LLCSSLGFSCVTSYFNFFDTAKTLKYFDMCGVPEDCSSAILSGANDGTCDGANCGGCKSGSYDGTPVMYFMSDYSITCSNGAKVRPFNIVPVDCIISTSQTLNLPSMSTLKYNFKNLTIKPGITLHFLSLSEPGNGAAAGAGGGAANGGLNNGKNGGTGGEKFKSANLGGKAGAIVTLNVDILNISGVISVDGEDGPAGPNGASCDGCSEEWSTDDCGCENSPQDNGGGGAGSLTIISNSVLPRSGTVFSAKGGTGGTGGYGDGDGDTCVGCAGCGEPSGGNGGGGGGAGGEIYLVTNKLGSFESYLTLGGGGGGIGGSGGSAKEDDCSNAADGGTGGSGSAGSYDVDYNSEAKDYPITCNDGVSSETYLPEDGFVDYLDMNDCNKNECLNVKVSGISTYRWLYGLQNKPSDVIAGVDITTIYNKNYIDQDLNKADCTGSGCLNPDSPFISGATETDSDYCCGDDGVAEEMILSQLINGKKYFGCVRIGTPNNPGHLCVSKEGLLDPIRIQFANNYSVTSGYCDGNAPVGDITNGLYLHDFDDRRDYCEATGTGYTWLFSKSEDITKSGSATDSNGFCCGDDVFVGAGPIYKTNDTLDSDGTNNGENLRVGYKSDGTKAICINKKVETDPDISKHLCYVEGQMFAKTEALMSKWNTPEGNFTWSDTFNYCCGDDRINDIGKFNIAGSINEIRELCYRYYYNNTLSKILPYEQYYLYSMSFQNPTLGIFLHNDANNLLNFSHSLASFYVAGAANYFDNESFGDIEHKIEDNTSERGFSSLVTNYIVDMSIVPTYTGKFPMFRACDFFVSSSYSPVRTNVNPSYINANNGDYYFGISFGELSGFGGMFWNLKTSFESSIPNICENPVYGYDCTLTDEELCPSFVSVPPVVTNYYHINFLGLNIPINNSKTRYIEFDFLWSGQLTSTTDSFCTTNTCNVLDVCIENICVDALNYSLGSTLSGEKTLIQIPLSLFKIDSEKGLLPNLEFKFAYNGDTSFSRNITSKNIRFTGPTDYFCDSTRASDRGTGWVSDIDQIPTINKDMCEAVSSVFNISTNNTVYGNPNGYQCCGDDSFVNAPYFGLNSYDTNIMINSSMEGFYVSKFIDYDTYATNNFYPPAAREQKKRVFAIFANEYSGTTITATSPFSSYYFLNISAGNFSVIGFSNYSLKVGDYIFRSTLNCTSISGCLVLVNVTNGSNSKYTTTTNYQFMIPYENTTIDVLFGKRNEQDNVFIQIINNNTKDIILTNFSVFTALTKYYE